MGGHLQKADLGYTHAVPPGTWPQKEMTFSSGDSYPFPAQNPAQSRAGAPSHLCLHGAGLDESLLTSKGCCLGHSWLWTHGAAHSPLLGLPYVQCGWMLGEFL